MKSFLQLPGLMKTMALAALLTSQAQAQAATITCDMSNVDARPYSQFRFVIKDEDSGSIAQKVMMNAYSPRDSHDFTVIPGCEDAKVRAGLRLEEIIVTCANGVKAHLKQHRAGDLLYMGRVQVGIQNHRVECF